MWVKDYPLWLAHYPGQYIPGIDPVLPRGWFKWTLWQYSKKGRVNGVNANVDLDVFNGSLEELYQFAGSQINRNGNQTPQKHTVMAGDSFESIANKYGITVRELVGANPQLLKTGEQLTVPSAVAIPAENGGGANSDHKTHTVKTGENLTLIAIKYGTTVAAIASANNISNINSIAVGQVLIIP